MEGATNLAKNSNPLLFDFKCRFCGLECEMIALNGLESETIQCPRCKRRIAKDDIERMEKT